VSFAAGQQRVGLDVPRSETHATGSTRSDELVPTTGTNLEVVLDHDRLTIEDEPSVGVLAQEVEDSVDRVDQPSAESLERAIPLAVPVRVRHHDASKTRSLNHRQSLAPRSRERRKWLRSVTLAFHPAAF
jgi:hypothetical protein